MSRRVLNVGQAFSATVGTGVLRRVLAIHPSSAAKECVGRDTDSTHGFRYIALREDGSRVGAKVARPPKTSRLTAPWAARLGRFVLPSDSCRAGGRSSPVW